MAMSGEPSPQAAAGGGAAAAGGTATAGTAAGGGGGQEVVVGTAPRTATMFACVTTLSNTLLGVSVVGVAGGFSRAGYTVSAARQGEERRRFVCLVELAAAVFTTWPSLRVDKMADCPHLPRCESRNNSYHTCKLL